jgi:DEAD/DEAH box helicase domain-containing protein
MVRSHETHVDPADLSLYLYDSQAGGVGLSAPLFRLSDRPFKQTRELIDGCGCEAGCPACVGPVGEIGDRGKEAALAILSGCWIAGEPMSI